jgi:K+-sensing histidine kinase KdpD
VNIHVRDSGEGFGDTDPNELFERYGQITKRAQSAHRGVGLGLYYCTLAVTAMSGSITAANHPDGGAVFTICLPKITGGNK